MAMFGKMKKMQALEEHGNFDDFPRAFLLLFRALTGEGWNSVMRDCMVQPPFCDENAGECGWPMAAPIFWVSFQTLSAFLLVNVVVAVVLQIFEAEMEKERERGTDFVIDLDDIEMFGAIWSRFTNSRSLPVSKLPDFLNALPPDLGYRGASLRCFSIFKTIDSLNLPSDGYSVHYLDVLYRLCWRAFRLQNTRVYRQAFQDVARETGADFRGNPYVVPSHAELNIDVFNSVALLIRSQALRDFPELRDHKRWRYRASLIGYVVMLQRAWRGSRERRKLLARWAEERRLLQERRGNRNSFSLPVEPN